MAQSLSFFIKSSLFAKEKTLLIEPDSIEFDNNNFSKFEIAELRYGIEHLRGYYFWMERTYCIDVKSLDGRIIKIRFSSFYRIKRAELDKKYKTIAEAILGNFMIDIIQEYISRFNSKTEFQLLGNTFTQQGIGFDKTNEIIPWPDLGTRNYPTYYSLFSEASPEKYRTFSYLLDWNTSVLHSLIKAILKARKM